MEAIQCFQEQGMICGILLSEKDSVNYVQTLAPELRILDKIRQVHHISDYSGANQQERQVCIKRIIEIAKEHKYDYVFAGYGFMAEDADFVAALETAGIGFIGPASSVHQQAGAKDTAKTIARQIKVSVIPGVDNISALTLLAKVGAKREKLDKLVQKHKLDVTSSAESDIEKYAAAILHASYKQNVPLIQLEDLQKQAQIIGGRILQENKASRLRLKYIGGGGGKGQRIVTEASQIPNAVLEVLSESKALGATDNKNFLLELNIENTRHNEIQLLGNGEWCVALGGRDCSLQIHEQKLVELSISDELFAHELEQMRTGSQNDKQAQTYAQVLEEDRKLLNEMEKQAMHFGKAVGLNSASTFETIVAGQAFYFMEMNTRIQVEHRVSEMIYKLRFVNPANANEFFEVTSLLHAMALLAAHGAHLPCPQRLPRHMAGAEVRLNAQNAALQPAAGGTIEFWSPPIANELRDDQGISIRHPETNEFMRYYLAGAYDSNIALLVSHGAGRRHNLEQLLEIVRCASIRGQELCTNKDFHYGILNFCLSLHPMLKPNTNFVQIYLLAVAALAAELEQLELDYAWQQLRKQVQAKFSTEGVEILEQKQTLLLRPIRLLQKNPHICAGWLLFHLRYKKSFSFVTEKQTAKMHVQWHRNPWQVLAELYHYLRLEARDNAHPIEQIWAHDQKLLESGLEFYDNLTMIDANSALHTDHTTLCVLLNFSQESSLPVANGHMQQKMPELRWKKKQTLNKAQIEQCQTLHVSWQLGLKLFDLLLHAAHRSGIMQIDVGADLVPIFPQKFTDIALNPKKQKAALNFLEPPPSHSSDTIVAVSGGMYYGQETPDAAPFLQVGQYFNVGDPIYIIEVMKMFNKVCAEFSGTVIEVLIDTKQGKVVKKGQALFRVKPDQEIISESPAQKQTRRQQHTQKFLLQLG